MKIKRIALSVATLILCGVMCGCSVINPSTSQTSNVEAESIISQSSEIFKESLEIDKDKLTKYLYSLANFVNSAIEKAEDIKNLDIFYFLVVTAEQYATYAEETYAIDSEQSTYNFPLKDLQELAVKLFNVEYDFSSYIDNTYFDKVARLADYYDETTSAFNIVFAGAFYPISDNLDFVSCYKIKSICSEKNDIIVECELGVSQGLGSTAKYFDATYVFEVFEENNLPYYQLKGLTTNTAG